ncbi:MAG: SGNH/GDSL hydrolase family protein [Sphingobacteriales bacterium]|nr:SGNH/GDSL hydrolase family protein [Sphingobacteriales bacterium]
MSIRAGWVIIACFCFCTSRGQQETLKWWNPAATHYKPEGQGWPSEVLYPYDRFPARAKKNVREVVWFKSQQSTGLIIKFRTDATYIHIRYKVKDTLFFEHMPSTGVSGLDLYALNKNGGWSWAGADYIFADTVQYFYNNLAPVGNKTYYLYLPLYNRVDWLEIGVPTTASFTPVDGNDKGSLVIYGTSIAQGGCASRPGMAWTAILGRRLHMPVINIGFSSNGQLERPVADLISELDAGMIILDCMPNMHSFSEAEITSRLEQTVNIIRSRHPLIPIIIAQHADANINQMNTSLDKSFKKVNDFVDRAFKKLKSKSVQNIYFLSAAAIGLTNESTVDGQHPSDLGMKQYADAYEQLLKKIPAR